MLAPEPTLPKQRGIFSNISPAQFRAVARKAQGFTDAENAHDGYISKKTVSSYLDAARHRLSIPTTQELIWCYHLEYAPQLLYPDGTPGIVYGEVVKERL